MSMDNKQNIKDTYTLYRCNQSEWEDMKWKEALLYRESKAKEACMFYKAEAEKIKITFQMNI